MPQRSKEVVDRVLDGIMSGRSLNSLCGGERDKEKYPSRQSFMEWVRSDKKLAKDYGTAMELRADLYFDEILEIADEGPEDVEVMTKQGVVTISTITHEMIQNRKLRIDSRKWIISRMRPMKYGDQTQRTTEKDDGGNVLRKTTEYVVE